MLNTEARHRISRTTIALLLSGLATSAVFALAGSDPLRAWDALFRGSLGSAFGVGEVLMLGSVLVLTGLAAAIPATAHLWNVGGEGQLYIGALAAAVAALNVGLSGPVATVAALAASACAGAVWASVAAILLAKFEANEVLTTLMLNFVAILLVDLVLARHYQDSGIPNASPMIPTDARLPELLPNSYISATVVIALAMVLFAHVLLSRTALGLKIRSVGFNADASRCLGLRVEALRLVALSLGGACAGLAGGVVVLGIQGLLLKGFSPGFGFVGIAVAMLAVARPLRIIPFAALFAVLSVGGSYLEPAVGISSSAALLGQYLLVLLVLAFSALSATRIGMASQWTR